MRQLNKEGFTLLELLIGIAVLSVVGLMATALFAFSVRMYHTTIVYADLQTESQTVCRRLERAIMGAQAIYMEAGETGTYLFTGETTKTDTATAYKGEIFWWNKETGCLYQNSSFHAEEEPDSGLSGETVKTVLESGTGGGKEFLISDKVKALSFSLIPDLEGKKPLEENAGFYKIDEQIAIHFEMGFQYLDSKMYSVNSSAAPRNKIGLLWWKDEESGENTEETPD